MSGSNPKSSIPAWQHASASSTSPPPASEEPTKAESQPEAVLEQSQSTSMEDSKPTPSAPLLEQAAKFLDDPAIRDSPREKKVAFLQSKGVSTDDINTLLEGTERNNSPVVDKSKPASTPTTSPTPKPQPRELPPIVTYPEFLTQPSAPPPLITTQRLVNTAYIAGGLFATLYGLSKYIVNPMTANLTEARHDFSQHTQEHIKKLNNQLARMVSVDPAAKAKVTKDIEDAPDDVSEADSDPTELYHRDFGTQTTPTLSRRPSLSESDASEEAGSVKAHENRLKLLTTHLRQLHSTRSKDKDSSNAVRTQVTDLTTYLTEMTYQNSYYSSMGGLYSTPSYGASKGKDGKEDQIEALKADIRAVKGVLLSARNFPTGSRSLARTGA